MSDQMTTTERLDPTQAIRALSSIILDHQSYDTVLQRTTEIARQTIPGAREVSVTLHNDKPRTVASTGSLATVADDAQYQNDDGPCLQAMRSGKTVVVDDLEFEDRWPAYDERAADAGVRSSCSVPLSVEGRPIGALNAYAVEPGAFDAAAVGVAEEMAVFAAVALSNAGLYFTATGRAEQMAEAMKSRAVIEQAKGILMGGRRCDADEAFEILVGLSRESHRKLRDVARTLVERATHDGS
jgi:GAF domain-containing protein